MIGFVVVLGVGNEVVHEAYGGVVMGVGGGVYLESEVGIGVGDSIVAEGWVGEVTVVGGGTGAEVEVEVCCGAACEAGAHENAVLYSRNP